MLKYLKSNKHYMQYSTGWKHQTLKNNRHISDGKGWVISFGISFEWPIILISTFFPFEFRKVDLRYGLKRGRTPTWRKGIPNTKKIQLIRNARLLALSCWNGLITCANSGRRSCRDFCGLMEEEREQLSVVRCCTNWTFHHAISRWYWRKCRCSRWNSNVYVLN